MSSKLGREGYGGKVGEKKETQQAVTKDCVT